MRLSSGSTLVLCFAAVMALLVPTASALCRKPMRGATLAEPPVVVWGSETMIGFGSGFRESQGAKPGVEGPWLGPLVTALMLTLISRWMFLHRPAKPSTLYWLVTFYPFATAIVELIRVNFDSSRFGFLTAAWHNLPEYGMLLYMLQSKKNADKYFPLVLLWEWVLHVWIMFVPSLNGIMRGVFFAGFAEQLTGICCDFLLMVVFTYMYFSAKVKGTSEAQGTTNVATEDPTKSLKTAYLYAMLGAYCHMLEIGPLVVMLSGIAPRPYLPVCIIVAFTSPITMYLYGKFIQEYTSGAAASISETKDAVKGSTTRKLLALGIVLGLSFILSPALVPYCPGTAPVKPGALNATDATCTSLLPTPAAAPAMCLSKSKLTGTTTVWPKPGKEQAVMDMVATMPGPIRLEDGSLGYDIAYGRDHEGRFVVKFFESWSSITSLYRHIYTSPTVNRVFRSPEFAALVEKQLLEGPFEAAVPCTEAQSEAVPVTLPFSTIVDAPVDCLWAKFDNWCGDSSWVSRSKGATPSASTSSAAKTTKGKKKKNESAWPRVHCSSLLRVSVLTKLAAATKKRGASMSPAEVDAFFDSVRKEVKDKVTADEEASRKEGNTEEANQLAAHLKAITKLEAIHQQRKGATWNSLVWTWVTNINGHGSKVRKGGKFSVAALQNENQETELKEAAKVLQRFSDLGHGLAGVETIKPAQLQQQAMREAAHQKRKAAEDRMEEQQRKQCKLMEEVVEVVKEKAGQQGDLCEQIARSNDLKEKDIAVKADIASMMRQLIGHYVAAQQARQQPSQP